MGRSRKRRRQIQIKSMKGASLLTPHASDDLAPIALDFDGDNCSEDDSTPATAPPPTPIAGIAAPAPLVAAAPPTPLPAPLASAASAVLPSAPPAPPPATPGLADLADLADPAAIALDFDGDNCCEDDSTPAPATAPGAGPATPPPPATLVAAADVLPAPLASAASAVLPSAPPAPPPATPGLADPAAIALDFDGDNCCEDDSTPAPATPATPPPPASLVAAATLAATPLPAPLASAGVPSAPVTAPTPPASAGVPLVAAPPASAGLAPLTAPVTADLAALAPTTNAPVTDGDNCCEEASNPALATPGVPTVAAPLVAAAPPTPLVATPPLPLVAAPPPTTAPPDPAPLVAATTATIPAPVTAAPVTASSASAAAAPATNTPTAPTTATASSAPTTNAPVTDGDNCCEEASNPALATPPLPAAPPPTTAPLVAAAPVTPAAPAAPAGIAAPTTATIPAAPPVTAPTPPASADLAALAPTTNAPVTDGDNNEVDNNMAKLKTSSSEFTQFDKDNKLSIKIKQLLNINSNSLQQQNGGRIDESITNVENTYKMIGGLKLDINPKFRIGLDKHSRNYADDQVAVKNFTNYFVEITFGLQLLLKNLFEEHDKSQILSQILTDFFSLYVNKLYTVLKPNTLTNTKLPIIVSNYSIYEITRKVIFSCFEKFVKEKILITDTSSSADSSELDLSKDMILVKLSFSLPQLVEFFVESFTNLDNLDNNILKPGSNNALINYYNLKLGNVFNTSVEKKEDFALISDELTKIFKTVQDNKETNHLKFYREKIHKIDKIINDHQDETFGLLIEQIQKIITGFTITDNGLLFESKEFAGLKLTIQPSDLEKRKAELEKELADIQSKLTAATPPSTTSSTAAPGP